MRILLIAESLSPENGWGTIARHTAQDLKKRGHDVRALVHSTSAQPVCLERSGLPPANPQLDSQLARTIAALRIWWEMRTWKPDVIHVAVEPYALGLVLAARWTTMPPWLLILLGTYTVLPLEQSHTRTLMRRVYEQAGALLSCSAYTRDRALEAIEKHCGPTLRATAEQKLQLFRLGIDEPAPSPTRIASDGPKRILFVGGVKPRKGVAELVLACASLHTHSSIPFRLDIIGAFQEEKEYIRQLRASIREHGLEDIVTLRGHVAREEVEQAYDEADLFVMLSKVDGVNFEGFGMVFLEANARGIPVIGPNGSGCKEAIDDGVSGYVADPDDATAVAERMRWVLEEERIQREDCIAWARKHNIETQTAAFEAAYARMRGEV